MSDAASSEINSGYALELANSSYNWYWRAAKKARRYYRLSETSNLLASVAIPVSAVAFPDATLIPATLGGVVALIAGLRSIFHWHDDYMRFSEAREAVEAERRLYLTNSEPYIDTNTRDKVLATSITKIEQREMNAWTKIARPRNTKNG